MAKLEAKLETIVDSVGNFFSGKDQLPWCDPDIVAVKIEVATIQGVGILWRDFVIPKGCFVVPFLSAVHLDENVYNGALNLNLCSYAWLFCLHGFDDKLDRACILNSTRLKLKSPKDSSYLPNLQVQAIREVWDVLSNEEVVEIVSSAPTRSSAARILVDAAAREWKLKYPTSKMNDCAVVCLFLDGKDGVSDIVSAAKVAAVAHPLAEKAEEIASNISYHAQFSPHFSPLKFELEQAYYATAESVRDRLIKVVLAASIVGKFGKVLVSRQFVDNVVQICVLEKVMRRQLTSPNFLDMNCSISQGETVTNIHHWNVGHTSFQYKTWSVTLHFLFMKLSPLNQFQLLKPDKALELGIINSRHEAFITSKLWCNNDHHDLVLPALKTTLKKLGLDYLDLYLIHMPVRLKSEVDGVLEIGKDDLLPFDIEGTWEQLWHKKLTQLLENATIPPTVNQVEMSSSWQQGKLREFCKQKGIHLAAWSPFSSKVTDIGIHFLKGLQNLALLNLEGCFVTAACLDTLADLSLVQLATHFSPPTERDHRRPPIHVIVICPTRELASQATTEVVELLKYHPTIGVQVVIGGTRLAIQYRSLLLHLEGLEIMWRILLALQLG
ncbi:hypothetical protein AHAS_Ahas14G0178700 [Arachis hypogaea]